MIKIERLSPVYTDKRGSTYRFKERESSEFIIVERKGDTISGQHYHKGLTKSKNPEIFFLVGGEIRLTVINIKTNEKEEHYIEKNAIVKIEPFVYHEVYALTDMIILEFLIKDEDTINDTFKLS